MVAASDHIHLIVTVNSQQQMSDFMCYIDSNVAREIGKPHGCKEGLVMRPGDWPGVDCVEALTRGKPLKGVWYDRTKQYEASRDGEPVSMKDFVTLFRRASAKLRAGDLTDVFPPNCFPPRLAFSTSATGPPG